MLCLPKPIIDAFRSKLQDGTINPDKLSSMSSAERRDLLSSIVGEDHATEVNTLIESKLDLKNQERGLITAMRQILAGNTKAQTDFVSKIEKIDHLLTPAEEKSFLSDLVSKKLGIGESHVTPEQAKKISDLTEKVREAKNLPPKLSGVSDEFLKAQTDLKSYVDSLKPTSAPVSIAKDLATIGRNNLLLNPATPIKTTVGQMVNSVMDGISRRIGLKSLSGDNVDLAAQANKEAWDTFIKTGNNTASMESIDDAHVLNKGENFRPTEGKTLGNKALQTVEKGTRTLANFSTKVAINWEHNITFTKFYQKSFFDMLNLASSKMAETEGLAGEAAKARSAEIFKDAAKIKPETGEGAMLRAEAQKQAARITSTNDTAVSNLAVDAKRMLNTFGNRLIKGFNLGDFIVPMAKIPANVIANGLDNAGVGIPKGIMDYFQGHEKLQSTDLQTRYEGLAQMTNGIQRLARIAGTLSVAALITSRLSPQDFKTDKYGVSFVRIGNTWINTEYIIAISPALAGMMSVKQNGGNLGQKAIEYGRGVGIGLLNQPGVSELNQLYQAALVSKTTTYWKQFFTSRGEPAFLNNVLQGKIKNLFFGTTGVQNQQEMNQHLSGKSTTNWSQSTSKELQQFHSKVGDQKFQEANNRYNQLVSGWTNSMATNKTFQVLPSDVQKKVITNKKTKFKEQVFKEYNFTYQQKPAVKLPSF